MSSRRSAAVSQPVATALVTSEQAETASRLVLDPVGLWWSVEEAFRFWQGRKTELAPKVEAWRSTLPADQKDVVGKLDPFLLAEMLSAAGHGDLQYTTDLLAGFPVTGEVGIGGTGTDIPGGQRSRGRQGFGGVQSLDDLYCQSWETNMASIKRAKERHPTTPVEKSMAEEVWKKTTKDIAMGRAGEPVDLWEIDLREVLLVEAFGVQEKRGSAQESSVRGIHNFRKNQVNDYAWMPQKLRYDTFQHVMDLLSSLSSRMLENNVATGLHMGKADFQSAFKALPRAQNQAWLSGALVYNPIVGRLQAVPLWSQVFGSLGGVTSWFRTAKALQHIMFSLFFLVVFLYVDDAFWATTDVLLPTGQTQAEWVGNVFQRVVSQLLGWELDPRKADFGPPVLLLGLQL